MDFSTFQKNFPPGSQLPALLIKLFEYQNQVPGWYSGRFQLCAERFGDADAFDGDAEAAVQFAHFGRISDGSTYAFWLYPGQTLETAPIVFVGSEGTEWTVLAETMEDFLSLLALGETELGYSAANDYFTGPAYNLEELEHFRNWLKTAFGIVPAAHPIELVHRAKSRHPDLQAWLTHWQEHHFGQH
ncbi:MAG TPA: hypothetical protein PLL06_12555 [Acidobacteriota bacterium]|nr:hypothetical protein [Acidobacteriota bacterium]